MTEDKGLPYDMGNAGDLIKHGALALFVQWWCENNTAKTLRFADPFGGCPRQVMENAEIKRRLNELAAYGADANGFDGAAIAECLWDGTYYYNSGNIARRAANKYGNPPEVWTSDGCRERRDKLAASDFRILDGGKFDGYQCDNGYSILPHAGKFDLVLIDPFGDFLPCEITLGFPTFNKIKSIVETAAPDGRDVCVAVFIVAKKKEFKRYSTFRRCLKDIAIALRCPKIKGKDVRGEGMKTEILLISKTFADGGGRQLRARLETFTLAAQTILTPNITMWRTNK